MLDFVHMQVTFAKRIQIYGSYRIQQSPKDSIAFGLVFNMI